MHLRTKRFEFLNKLDKKGDFSIPSAANSLPLKIWNEKNAAVYTVYDLNELA